MCRIRNAEQCSEFVSIAAKPLRVHSAAALPKRLQQVTVVDGVLPRFGPLSLIMERGRPLQRGGKRLLQSKGLSNSFGSVFDSSDMFSKRLLGTGLSSASRVQRHQIPGDIPLIVTDERLTQ